jgi:F-type H+-transporting ATPase subunit epsilon
MAEGTIDLTIVTPERSVVHEQVDELQIPGAGGYFGVLPGHAPLFSELKVGKSVIGEGASGFTCRLPGALWKCNRTRCAFWRKLLKGLKKSIWSRATRAKKRAEERIAKGGDTLDYNRALIALERALIRIQVAARAHHRLNT